MWIGGPLGFGADQSSFPSHTSGEMETSLSSAGSCCPPSPVFTLPGRGVGRLPAECDRGVPQRDGGAGGE